MKKEAIIELKNQMVELQEQISAIVEWKMTASMLFVKLLVKSGFDSKDVNTLTPDNLLVLVEGILEKLPEPKKTIKVNKK